METQKRNLSVLPEVNQNVDTRFEMTMLDAWNSLCSTLVEKKTGSEAFDTAEQTHDMTNSVPTTRRIDVSPELRNEGRQLLRRWLQDGAFITEVSSEADIEGLINSMFSEVHAARSESGLENLSEDEEEELRAQAWIYFDFLRDTLNTRLIERETLRFYGKDFEDTPEHNKKQLIDLLSKKKYSPNAVELSLVIDLIKSQHQDPQHSFADYVDTFSHLWDTYQLGEHKSDIAKLSFGYLASQGIGSVAPLLASRFVTDGVIALGEYELANIASGLLKYETDAAYALLEQEIARKLNERIAESLFFSSHRFEFDQSMTQAEMYAIVERGKRSTVRFIGGAIQKLAPLTTGVSMSIACLGSANPAMGAIAMGSVPLMVRSALKHRRTVRKTAKGQSKAHTEAVSARQSALGMRDVAATSPHSSRVAQYLLAKMNATDSADTQAYVQSIQMNKTRWLQNRIVFALALVTGGIMEKLGIVKGGDAFAGILYSERLMQPIRELVEMYVQSSKDIHDIEEMEKVLGNGASKDLPDGEQEAQRVPVSQLEGRAITIRDVSYSVGKHKILDHVNMNVPEGTFCALVGPSGGGKSTLLRSIVGLNTMDDGQILLGGSPSNPGVDFRDIKRYGQESRFTIMSYAPQRPPLFEDMTLRENLLLWSAEPTSDAEMFDVLRLLNMDKFATTEALQAKPQGLSGGELVRLGFARMLLKKNASILLIDEPTAGLDDANATTVREALLRIHTRNDMKRTILCATHDERLIALVGSMHEQNGQVVNIAEIQNGQKKGNE